MRTVLPRFRDYCRSSISRKDYDYIVPLETKGIILVNLVTKELPEWETRLRYLRSFDFAERQHVEGKTAACIDDTVVYGRTLERASDVLKAHGIRADKYACMERLDPGEYDRSGTADVQSCLQISLRDYDLMAPELSELTFLNRPTFPDHLSFRATLHRPTAEQSIALGLSGHGTLMTYTRPGDRTDYSLHYPDFSPLTPKGGKDTGPEKIRFRVSDDGTAVYFVPENFPSLLDQALLTRDTLSAEYFRILTRPWHRTSTCALNSYEAFTLATRTRMAANFIAALHEYCGVATTQIELMDQGLQRYFGPQVSQEIRAIALRKIGEPTTPRTALCILMPDPEECPDIFFGRELLSIVRQHYREANTGRADRASWQSAGLSVAEIARRAGHSKPAVSVGIESLNNYGYLVPFQEPKLPGERAYRCTELGGRQLAADYGTPN